MARSVPRGKSLLAAPLAHFYALPRMKGRRDKQAIQIGLSAAAALFILAGASLNVTGRAGQTAVLATAGGLLILLAGAIHTQWKFAAPLVAAAIGFALLSAHLNIRNPELPLNLVGLLFLLLGGFIGSMAFDSFHRELRVQLVELEELNRQLDEKHRAFLAATADAVAAPTAGDIGAMTASIAQQVGASMACYYLTSPDGKEFVPQPPGVGLEQVRPHGLSRSSEAGPLLAAIEAGQDFVATDAQALQSVLDYLPTGFEVEGVLAAPMRVGEHIGGFILLANKPGGFTEDDRRLAMTLTLRAGAQLASAHTVALSKKELARYSLLNQLVKEASGKTTDDVFKLILDKGKELIRYDSARVALFQPDGTFVTLGGSEIASPMSGPLARVMTGETVIRTLVTAEEVFYSGLEPTTAGGNINEALTPIRGKSGVIGAICLGRSGLSGFAARDVSALEELGTMAGVAIENSMILQQVSGQASKLDTALDALGEVSQALTTVTEGAVVLEQKTMQTAVRVTGATHALLTRTSSEGHQRVIMAVNFPSDADGMEFRNGQGIIGAVMLNGRAAAVSDLSASPELSSPPDLASLGIKAAVCVPMVGEGQLWGTLSVYDVKRREWTPNDQRVLATLGSQGVVAVKNAELYEEGQRRLWELSNLQKGLRAVTSTLDLTTVLEQLLNGAAQASGAQIGCLALEEEGKLKLYGAYGTDNPTADKLALGLGGDICRDVMSTGQPFLEHMDRGTDAADTPLNPRAVLCVPINLRGKPTGVLFLANYKIGAHFSGAHRDVVTELAAQAAIPIDNSRIVLAALEALANAVDARDPYTAGHSKRVTAYAETIAKQMNYAATDAAAKRRLHQGGLLHDIGKIKVPDAVLSKPGKLTDAEFELMKAHPVTGFNILRPLNMLTDELVIVRSHHERFDGKGYPDGKKGNELPIYAWVVSAADALDAMTSDRPYRKGMPLDVALQQVQEGAGSHFHPDVAEAVLDAARTGALRIIPQEMNRFSQANLGFLNS